MTARTTVPLPYVAALVALAAVFWFVTFALPWSVFWLKIAVAATTLAALSLWLRPLPREHLRLDLPALIEGLISAAVLYLIFWFARRAAVAVLPLATDEISSIYAKGGGFPLPVVFLLLLLVTGPAEEIFWRGFLQRHLQERYGGARGWLLSAAIYAGVHIWSLNLMLIGAAAVAGLYWGFLYWRRGRLGPVIVSHSVWSAVIFAVAPVG
jgi:hypothetical protein